VSQRGFVFRKGASWFLRYRTDFQIDGKIIRKQKCEKLAEYGDRYRSIGDLDDLVAEKMAGVRQAAKCPHSSDSFESYVEEVYLPFVLRKKKPSTYSGYKTYWERYIKPRVEKYALRDFTVAVVAGLLKDIAAMHKLNTDTVTKIRSVLSGIFSYAMSEGHFPARSAADNPASRARIPETATEPETTVAATFEDVQAILAALKEMPLERAAVALAAFTGARPSELRGLRWEEWDRAKQHIAVNRAVWHAIVGTTKTEQSVRYVTVTAELREILLALWNAQGSPLRGYILAGKKEKKPVNLDNMSKRSIIPALSRCAICKEAEFAEHKEHEFQPDDTLPRWYGFYSLRRFHATQVRMESDSSETAAKALGNTKDVCDKHYIKPKAVLPDVRRAVNGAFTGLIQ
jgi:integrase